MSNLPKIIDNQHKTLLEVITNISPNYKDLSIATGYWDLEGTKQVLDSINAYEHIRLLIGREPLINRHRLGSPEIDFPEMDINSDLSNIPVSAENKETIAKIKSLIESGKLEVRIYRKSFLHAKCYIFGNYNSDSAVGIIGSSNFTGNGLTANAELNSLESDHRIVTYRPQTKEQETGHLYWFDTFWDNSEPWSGKFSDILGMSPVGDMLYSPYETYIKTLHDLYLEELEDEKLEISGSGENPLLDFQIKNVYALKRRLNKYGVAMLADSVGLGKTYTALEVIKQYLVGTGTKQRVEIICPKSLVSQWKSEMQKQGLHNLRSPITLQNPEQIKEEQKLDDIAGVSLFVIDEAHNLKNRAGKRFAQIVEWIKNNPGAHVLLLTATPINNQLSDITNQILLGSRGMADIFKLTVVDSSGQTVQKDFNQAIEDLKKKINKDVTSGNPIDYEYIRQIMAPILRTFVVRRTRQGIQKEYGSLVVNGKSLKFPTVVPEVTEYGFNPEVSNAVQQVTTDLFDVQNFYNLNVNQIIDYTQDLKHPIDQIVPKLEATGKPTQPSSPISYMYKNVLLLGFLPYRYQIYKTRHYGKTRSQIRELKLPSSESKSLFQQISMYGILRTVFLKRLESSVDAFKKSLDIYERKLNVFEEGIKDNKIVSMKDFVDLEKLFNTYGDDQSSELKIDDDQVVDTITANNYALVALQNDIASEREVIALLKKQLALLNQDDSKIKAFANLLANLKDKQNSGKKVLVFSFFSDTVEYLRKNLNHYAPWINEGDNAGYVSSSSHDDAGDMAERFSPNAQNVQLSGRKEIDYLVSTDVLSEGQNLQDCGVLINYDLHWNPVRMIQRNGRINRIGSPHDFVYVYNITPEKQLEEYLQLVSRLEGKINLIRNTIGTDTPVLAETENPLEFTDKWSDIYSASKSARENAMQLAEQSADLLLAEDEFVSDLKEFHSSCDQGYRSEVYGISAGKWGVMPTKTVRSGERPAILAMNTLLDSTGSIIGHTFVSSDKSGTTTRSIPQLQALEWLRTDKDDNGRTHDKISLNKEEIRQIIDIKSQTYEEDGVINSEKPQERSVLDIMYESHVSEEDIDLVRLAYATNNVLAREKIRKLVGSIVRAKRDNLGYLDSMQELILLAQSEKTSSKQVKQAFDLVIQQLIYVKDNS